MSDRKYKYRYWWVCPICNEPRGIRVTANHCVDEVKVVYSKKRCHNDLDQVYYLVFDRVAFLGASLDIDSVPYVCAELEELV